MARKSSTRAAAAPTDANGPPAPAESPYRQFETYRYLLILVAILIVIAWIGLYSTENREFAWLQILGLMTAFAVVLGRGITGYWRGILIDRRNKISLSRLQMLAWTLVVLSAVFTAALSNISFHSVAPLRIEIPSQLWVLMGISTSSLVASPAILGTKADKTAADAEIKRMQDADKSAVGLVACNSDPGDAQWSDLMMGEEVGNFGHVDLGKMQMFFFTFILVIGYAAAVGAMFRESDLVSALPAVDEGMNVLLGISHTGYLANKTVTHTREAGNA